jgi:hypothetical protein
MLVRRQDHNQREWDDRTEQNSRNDPPECHSGKPRCNGGDQSHRCQGRLHDTGSAVAGWKFSRRYFYSAFHSGRMFNKADIDGGSREQTAREHSNEFSN